MLNVTLVALLLSIKAICLNMVGFSQTVIQSRLEMVIDLN